MAERIPPGNLPLRVNQLDAASSDDYIYEIILDKLRDILKYLKISNIFTSCQREIEAAIKLTLWVVVFRRHHATLGQQLLELRYTSASCSNQPKLGSISRIQSVLYLICNIIMPYLYSKLADQQQHHRDFHTSHPLLSKLVSVLNAIWHILNLGNFVAFLFNGHFLHIYERLCGIRTVHPKGRQLREVGFEYSNREIVWHGFAEFMIFGLPYINTRKLKAIFSSESSKSVSNPTKFCLLCDSFPTNPQQISGCIHIYCYHCIASLIVTDGSMQCKTCEVNITSQESLQPAIYRIDSNS